MKLAQPHRIVIIGSTGSGKTTLGRALSKKLHIPQIELDALHWGPDWTSVGDEVLVARVKEKVSAEAWVLDGNYSKTRPYFWSRARTVIWLNYPLRVNFWRLLTRTLRRVFTREELWGGNQENLRQQLSPKTSIMVWLFQTHARRRRDYPILLAEEKSAHLQKLVFTSPRQLDRWLATLE